MLSTANPLIVDDGWLQCELYAQTLCVWGCWTEALLNASCCHVTNALNLYNIMMVN